MQSHDLIQHPKKPKLLPIIQAIKRYLERGESVFLVAPTDFGPALVENTIQACKTPTAFALVDLCSAETETRFGLLRAMVAALGHDAQAISAERDLHDFQRLLSAHAPARIALIHFECAIERYDTDLYASLAFLVSELRQLTLFIQSDRPLRGIDAGAASRFISLKTVEATIETI